YPVAPTETATLSLHDALPILGQRSFEQLYQGTGERQLFLAPIPTPGGELIVVALFGTNTNIGLVRVRFDELLRESEEVHWPTGSGRPVRDAAAFEAELTSGLERDGRG